MKQKNILTLVIVLLMSLLCIENADAKRKIKISVVPSDAQITIDGNYIGDGVVEYTLDRSDFIAIKIEKEGYLTQETRFFKSDKRNAISYTLRPDKFFEASVPSGLVNKFFSVTVSPNYYTINKNGKIVDTDKAWKLIHQILLNYFDEMQVTDASSSFIQTPWAYERFTESKQAVRTRVTVKQAGVSDEKLVFQIKVSSEQAPLVGMSNENSYREVVRILKKYEPLISEFQTRLGKQ
ncbi:MAG: PEGA domain-containing protein [Prevotella sp.]|nr:PEGA domain-containing protein [Prevotella sp.]